jgi:hypothetical protein
MNADIVPPERARIHFASGIPSYQLTYLKSKNLNIHLKLVVNSASESYCRHGIGGYGVSFRLVSGWEKLKLPLTILVMTAIDHNHPTSGARYHTELRLGSWLVDAGMLSHLDLSTRTNGDLPIYSDSERNVSHWR